MHGRLLRDQKHSCIVPVDVGLLAKHFRDHSWGYCGSSGAGTSYYAQLPATFAEHECYVDSWSAADWAIKTLLVFCVWEALLCLPSLLSGFRLLDVLLTFLGCTA